MQDADNRAGDRGRPADWGTDIWAWTPEAGPWSWHHGFPSQCVSFSVSTQAAPGSEGYDYWRETVFYDFDADPPDAAQREAFQACASGLVGPECSLFWYRSDAIGGRRTAAQCSRGEYRDLTLGLVLSGTRHHWLDNGEELVSGPGQFFLYDPTRPSRVNWRAHQGVHLALSRGDLASIGSPDLLAADQLLARMCRTPMAAFLNDHLRNIARYGAHLAPRQQALLLRQAWDLALATLGCASDLPAEESSPDATYHGALKLIRRHLSDPDLNPAALAGMLGCSRATLYRVFARQGVTVATCLREARLAQAHRLLRTAPAHIGIAELAARCGFVDNAGFSRLFRRRYGMRPSELRGSR